MSDPLMEKMLGLPEFEVTDFKQNNAVMISMFSRIAHQADGLSTLNNSSIGTCSRNRDHLVRICLPFAAQYVGKQRSAPKVVGSGLWCLRYHALSEFLPKEIKLIGK